MGEEVSRNYISLNAGKEQRKWKKILILCHMGISLPNILMLLLVTFVISIGLVCKNIYSTIILFMKH